MAIVYPGTPPGTEFDVFTVPTEPEGTPLSSAGTSDRNHPQQHDDEGAAIEALEHFTALSIHDHSGDPDHVAKGPKLTQAHTHEDADTDQSGGIHHHLGTGHEQAARGDHAHPIYVSGYQVCTSLTRPASPFVGMTIYETDSHAARVWDTFPPASSPSWRIIPMALVPVIRLRQSLKQQLVASGTILQWQDEIEDNFNFFNSAAPTNIVMKEAGLYLVEVGVQWDPQYVPDVAHAIVCVNGVETTTRNQQFMRGNLFTPGFSQTLQIAGKLRFEVNDVLTIKTKHVASGGLLGMIFSYFDSPSKINSRIDITFVQP